MEILIRVTKVLSMDILRIRVTKVIRPSHVTARKETRVKISIELSVYLQLYSVYVLDLTLEYSR